MPRQVRAILNLLRLELRTQRTLAAKVSNDINAWPVHIRLLEYHIFKAFLLREVGTKFVVKGIFILEGIRNGHTSEVLEQRLVAVCATNRLL